MNGLPDSLEHLANCFSALPGIGKKSALRLAFYIATHGSEQAEDFIVALRDIHTKLHFCRICGNICEGEVCEYCSMPSRTEEQICVVENFRDLQAIEQTGEYHGRYHVLNGVINPMDGITAEDINIASLLKRVSAGGIKEVILATNPNIEGEATANYISFLLKPYKVSVTRLAYGLAVGSGIEFADSVTLAHALSGRTDL